MTTFPDNPCPSGYALADEHVAELNDIHRRDLTSGKTLDSGRAEVWDQATDALVPSDLPLYAAALRAVHVECAIGSGHGRQHNRGGGRLANDLTYFWDMLYFSDTSESKLVDPRRQRCYRVLRIVVVRR